MQVCSSMQCFRYDGADGTIDGLSNKPICMSSLMVNVGEWLVEVTRLNTLRATDATIDTISMSQATLADGDE